MEVFMHLSFILRTSDYDLIDWPSYIHTFNGWVQHLATVQAFSLPCDLKWVVWAAPWIMANGLVECLQEANLAQYTQNFVQCLLSEPLEVHNSIAINRVSVREGKGGFVVPPFQKEGKIPPFHIHKNVKRYSYLGSLLKKRTFLHQCLNLHK